MTPFERLLAVMTKPSIALSYLGFVIISFVYFDKPVALYFHRLDFPAMTLILDLLTKLGLGVVYLSIFLFLALFFRYIRPNHEREKCAWFLWLCVLIPNLICGALKVTLGRARPDLLFDGSLYGFYGLHANSDFWSFPSGHTSTVMGLVFGLSVIYPRWIYTLIGSGLFIAGTRILLTDHYVSDVMATCYMTLLEVGLFVYYLQRKRFLTKSSCRGV